MKRNKKKGATLAEMCIVMAVVAIVSLSVTSFATMASGRGTAAATKLDAMGDLEIVEAVVESWILEATKDPENVINIDPEVSNKITATKNDPATSGSIMFDRQTLNVTFPNVDDAVLYRLKSIKGVQFAEETRGDGEREISLYYCTVTYQYRNGIVTKDQTYTFCVYPRVGEIVGGTNESTDNNANNGNGEKPDNGGQMGE